MELRKIQTGSPIPRRYEVWQSVLLLFSDGCVRLRDEGELRWIWGGGGLAFAVFSVEGVVFSAWFSGDIISVP